MIFHYIFLTFNQILHPIPYHYYTHFVLLLKNNNNYTELVELKKRFFIIILMRKFIYKTLVITVIIVIGFEFTIGKRIDPILESLNKIADEQGRKELIHKLRKEMNKGLEKEFILKEDDRVLVYNFFNKLMSEINSVEKN